MRAGLNVKLLILAWCGSGLALVALTLLAGPLGLGEPGFGYKKLLALLVGLETCGCGLVLRSRLHGLPE